MHFHIAGTKQKERTSVCTIVELWASQYWHPVCPLIAASHRMWVDTISSSSLEIREQCTDPEIKLEVRLWLICN